MFESLVTIFWGKRSSGIRDKHQDPGSRINIPDPQHCWILVSKKHWIPDLTLIFLLVTDQARVGSGLTTKKIWYWCWTGSHTLYFKKCNWFGKHLFAVGLFSASLMTG
jgi:hypothetical protein